MARSLPSSRALTITDLRRLAQRRLPRAVFDYLDGGAEGEVTLRENCQAFQSVRFRPRNAVSAPECDLRTSVLGTELAVPFLLAPIGLTRLLHPRGREASVARAAGAAGTAYILATFSGTPLEEVRAASEGPVWFQLYLTGGRDVGKAAIERARRAGYSALVVTIDTPVAGLRERDFRNGIPSLVSGNLFSKVPHVGQFLTRPRWLAGFLADGGLFSFPNVILPDGPMKFGDVNTALEQANVTWKDLEWIREAWPGDLVIKGVLTADDARKAVAAGAAGIVVSNHGGRQLDTVAPSLVALSEVVSAVDGRAEVFMDGGIRRGSDIVKAICMGARAVLIGRAYGYGAGAGGGPGVTRAIEILREDVRRCLKLLGCDAIAHLDRSYVDLPAEWLRGSDGGVMNDLSLVHRDVLPA